MRSCNNNSSCNNGYQYPKQTTAEDTALITFWNGCRYIGVSAKDFITAAKLGFYDNLDGLQDGDVLMFQDNEVVASGLRYDPEIDALVYTGKLIADEIEVSTETIFISQRVAIEAFGNSVEFKDNFNKERRLPIYTKITEQGSLGNFAAQVGAEQPITIQGDSSENYTSFSYSPPVTVGQVNASNSTRGHYRFSVAGINARIKVTAINAEGQEFVQFGTEAYPYKQFVTVAYDGTEATETIVEYPGGIYNTEGLTYTTVIETYDPETREISTEPLNILGSTASGVFRAYVLVDFQTVTEVELAGQGDVIGVGSAVAGDIPVYADNSGKSIQTSSAKIADFVKVTDPIYKQSMVIDEATTEIYEPSDQINRFFYNGANSSAAALKNAIGEYTEQDRFQIYNESVAILTVTDINGVELKQVQNSEAYEFFYKGGAFVIETLKTRKRAVEEYDVSQDSAPTLGPDAVGPLISITQSGNITIPMVFSLEAFDNFQTGDVIEISASNSYTNYFFGVLYTSSIGQQLVVYPNNSCRLTRTNTSWDIQQDGTFVRTGIRSATSRNTPLEPDGSSMIPVNGISVIDLPNDIASYIQDGEGHRVIQLDFTAIPTAPDDIDYRFGVNNWYDNGPAAEYQQTNPIQFLEMECNGGYIHQVIHQGFGYTTYLRVYVGNNTSKGVEFKDSTGRVSGRKTVRVGEIWKVTSAQKDSDSDVYWERIDDGTAGYVMDEDLVESFEANNDLILAPNSGVEFYLKDSDKDLGYGLNNVSTYFQPADGAIDLNTSDYLDYGQVYAVHKKVNSNKCLMMIHQNLVSELWGQSVDGVNKLSMVVKSGAKAALGMVNQTAPTGGVWNYQGFAIDIATTSDNANTTNPTKYLKDDGTEATVIADYARAIYSSGTFKNDGTTLLARGVVNFTANTATPNTFTEDDTSDYFVCSVTIGGGTFGQFKMMPVFMTKSSSSDMYDKKAVLFDDAASAVGELLTICYDGAEEASAIAEAAKTSDSFGEFKQKIEQTTITESI